MNARTDSTKYAVLDSQRLAARFYPPDRRRNMDKGRNKMNYAKVKRGLDFLIALVSLVALSPVFLFICVLVRLDSRGPVIFKQKRMGLRCKPFMMYKFRTMHMDAPKECPTHALDGAYDYITRTGRFLRRTSLDELPQLWNVLKGDMSLIGPRPVICSETDLIQERIKRGAYGIRPGMTGLAQVLGRDNVPALLKARYDGIYVQKMSFRFDCYVFFRTIKAVLSHEGVVEGGKQDEDDMEPKELPLSLVEEAVEPVGHEKNRTPKPVRQEREELLHSRVV